MNGHQFIPGLRQQFGFITRNTRPTQNELQVPSPPGRESVREYTSLASLTAMQLISGQFFISFQTPVLTFLNTR